MRKISFLFIALVLAAGPALAQDPGSGLGDLVGIDTTTVLTPEQAQVVVEELYGSLEQWVATGDPTGFMGQLEPEVRYIRLGDGTDVTGQEATIAALGALLGLAEGISFAVNEVRSSGPFISSSGIVSGTVPGTSYQLAVPFVHMLALNPATNKVAVIWDGTDLETLRAQLAEAPPAVTGVAERSWGDIKSAR